jgi:hypothetical protein
MPRRGRNSEHGDGPQGDLRLPDVIDLERQPRLHQLLLRVRKAGIGKHVAAAFDNAVGPGGFLWGFVFQGQFCLSLWSPSASASTLPYEVEFPFRRKRTV